MTRHLLKYWKAKLKRLHGRCIIIGLTGAPASGKSTVLKLFLQEGVFCVSADALAKEVLTEPECYNRILKKFGPEIVLKDGLPDTRGLSLEIFGDSSKRKWLEGLLHPEILKRIYSLIRKSHAKIAVVEAPLLFEAGLKDCFAFTVCVSAPPKARRARALKRGWSAVELERRTLAQFGEARKAALSDITLMNDGGVGELKFKINVLCGFLKALGPKTGEINNGKHGGEKFKRCEHAVKEKP
ncbi:MAG: dephospho-CoA kinase [Elusimicrobia bacterium]|nr:dephospho-CoA kinase [Elusimicrobiota bacterium]